GTAGGDRRRGVGAGRERDGSFGGGAAKRGRPPTATGASGTKGSLLLGAVASSAGTTLPPVPTTEEERAKTRPPVIVIVGKLLDPVLSAQREQLVQDFQAYRQLQVQKDDLRASHMLLFVMVTLVILRASSGTGLCLRRRVTVPILALAEGTRLISGGDLTHRVDVAADDELGILVDSFNRMTEELAASKGALEHSNRELTTSNERLAAERALIA